MPHLSPLVFIVDDDEGMLKSLKWLLGNAKIDCLCFENGNDFLNAYDDSQPSCIILDVRMPDISGFEVFEHIRDRRITAPVIFVTGNGTVPMAVKAIKYGALNFIEKPYEPDEMLALVSRALRDAAALHGQRSLRSAFDDKLAQLSKRELEVLREVVRGKRSKVIAYELGISCKTVDVHRTSIRLKFGTSSVAALVKEAISHMPDWRE